MSNIELKPCPFCGGEAEIIQNPKKSTTVYNYIKCKICGSTTYSFFYSRRCGQSMEQES